MKRKHSFVFKMIALLFFIVFFCEYLIYYIILSQCNWPMLNEGNADDSIIIEPYRKPVRAMFIADIHLQGPSKGNWFVKLRSEWQMHRSFQSAVSLFEPEVIFILGDLFDDGLKCSDHEFKYYMEKLHSLFSVNETIKIFYVAGNRDVGFHYDVTPTLYKRFVSKLKSPSVQMVTIRGNHFVLVNSMAMEGDGCFFCRPAQLELNKIGNKLRCARGIGKCPAESEIKQYSRPILLQHFPMYRVSDKQCSEPDLVPDDIKQQSFHERWDCLSREASESIYDNLKPRLIIGGHTHFGCHVIHRKDIHEYTIPTFNWRFKNNPSFLLGSFLPNNFAVSKCHVPEQGVVTFLYCLACFFILLRIILLFKFKNRIYYKPSKYD